MRIDRLYPVVSANDDRDVTIEFAVTSVVTGEMMGIDGGYTSQ